MTSRFGKPNDTFRLKKYRFYNFVIIFMKLLLPGTIPVRAVGLYVVAWLSLM